jgi:hypothetical protein
MKLDAMETSHRRALDASDFSKDESQEVEEEGATVREPTKE